MTRALTFSPEDIQQWRADHGLSQRAMAKLLNIDSKTLNRWENGQRQPPGYLSLALAELHRRLRRNKP